MNIGRYLIRRKADGNPVILMTHPETAEFYGWDKRFERHVEGQWRDPETGQMFLKIPRLGRGRKLGGIQIHISRNPNRSSAVAGQNNKFRVSKQAGFVDLCEIAKFTDVDWYWMTAFNGTRWTREEWLRFHDAYTAGREGAVVPREARLRAKPRTTDPSRLEQGRCRGFRDQAPIAAFQE